MGVFLLPLSWRSAETHNRHSLPGSRGFETTLLLLWYGLYEGYRFDEKWKLHLSLQAKFRYTT